MKKQQAIFYFILQRLSLHARYTGSINPIKQLEKSTIEESFCMKPYPLYSFPHHCVSRHKKLYRPLCCSSNKVTEKLATKQDVALL